MMFVSAIEKICEFTMPIVVNFRLFDGSVRSGIGTFLIVNDEGWIITAEHILAPIMQVVEDKIKIEEYNKQIQEIEADDSIDPKKKRKKISRIPFSNDWITHYSIALGNTPFILGEALVFADKQNDVAVAKIENFDPKLVKSYPKFINPKSIKPGTMLCKMGFPFPTYQASFNEEKQQFVSSGDPKQDNIVNFPLEGMYTRDIVFIDDNGNQVAKFIETSSPGIKGQSGGPTFDKDGNVWAIQSKTCTLPLDFVGISETRGRKVEENQFLNVGWGVHPETIINILNFAGAKFEMAKEA
jgi:S1-C subfamily serine protease